MKQYYQLNLRARFESYFLILITVLFALAMLVPLLMPGRVDAAQLTDRSLTIGTSEASATTTYLFTFDIPTSGAVQSMIFEFCTNPLGACTKPTGLDLSGQTVDDQNFTELTAFTLNTSDSNACTAADGGAAATMLCATRSDTDPESGTVDITFGGIDNPSTTSIDDLYVRITTYSDAAWTTSVDAGTVAAAIVDQLTVTGRVQERLQFCVASVADDGGADTTVQALASVSGCVALTDTTVDIGVIDNSTVALAPVPTGGSTLGDDEIGIAMINTNASSGTSLTFFAEPVVAGVSALAGETDQLRTFRVNGSTVNCDPTASTLTDQCFYAAPDTGFAVTPGNERFGMYVPCVDTSQGTIATPMTVDSGFDGADGVTTSATDCENEDKDDVDGNNSQTLAWNESSTAFEIASSTGVLDDAIVKLAFGAAASATTPTGTYTVVSTYIATPTF